MADWPRVRTDLLRKIAAHLAAGGGRLQARRSGKGRRKDGDSGAPVPADPGPRPLPLEGGAEAPLD